MDQEEATLSVIPLPESGIRGRQREYHRFNLHQSLLRIRAARPGAVSPSVIRTVRALARSIWRLAFKFQPWHGRFASRFVFHAAHFALRSPRLDLLQHPV